MNEGVVVVLVILILFLVAPPLLIALQGWLRDRARVREVARMREENASVLIVNTRLLPRADPTVPAQLVCASLVRCLDATRFSVASLKQLVGGEMRMINRNLTLSRDEATERLRQQVRELGLDTIINVRYETSIVMPMAAEVVVYGTAIRRSG